MDRLTEEYLDYNPDEDIEKYRGNMGLAIAEKIFKKYGVHGLKFKMNLNRLEKAIREKHIHSK